MKPVSMSDTEDYGESHTPATPDLFNSTYAGSDGRATPDDASSLDGMTTTTANPRKKKRRGRPPLYLTGEVIDGWTDSVTNVQYRVGGEQWLNLSCCVYIWC